MKFHLFQNYKYLAHIITLLGELTIAYGDYVIDVEVGDVIVSILSILYVTLRNT